MTQEDILKFARQGVRERSSRTNHCPIIALPLLFCGEIQLAFSLLPHEHNIWDKASASHSLRQLTALLYIHVTVCYISRIRVVLGGNVGITSHHVWGKDVDFEGRGNCERFLTLRWSDLVTNFFIEPRRVLLIGVSKHDNTFPSKDCFRQE